jgi:serine/threonine protein phosphatase PrpC
MIDFEVFTEPGSREINEDYVLTAQKGNNHIFVLADGLGGHGRGEEASKLVAEEMVSYFNTSDDFMNEMDKAFVYAQEKLLEKQRVVAAKFEMKTTVVVLAITDKEIRWGHIGDSRLYMFKKSHIKKRTLDHSVPQMLALAKDIKEKEIRFHPDRNKLLRVMGVQWGANSYELSKIQKKKKNTSFLLCSDGFWELITEKEMESFHKESSGSKSWINSMLPVIRKNGENQNMDNLSAIAVRL